MCRIEMKRLMKLIGRAPAIMAFTLALAMFAGARSGAQVQALPDSQVAAVQHARLMGAVAPSQVLSLSIGLQPRFPAELKAFCDAVSDPFSPTYRHYMTPDQVGEAFGAAATDVNNVVSYLMTKGIKITFVAPNRMAILAQATVAQAQAAFGTKINQYSLSGRTFRANESAVTLPSNIAPVVVNVGGLETFAIPHRR